MQFDGMVHRQIVGIAMGSNCAPLIADFFSCIVMRGVLYLI